MPIKFESKFYFDPQPWLGPSFCAIRSIFNVSVPCFPKYSQLLWVTFKKKSGASLHLIPCLGATAGYSNQSFISMNRL